MRTYKQRLVRSVAAFASGHLKICVLEC